MTMTPLDFQFAVNRILLDGKAEKRGEHGGLLSQAELAAMETAHSRGETPEWFVAELLDERAKQSVPA